MSSEARAAASELASGESDQASRGGTNSGSSGGRLSARVRRCSVSSWIRASHSSIASDNSSRSCRHEPRKSFRSFSSARDQPIPALCAASRLARGSRREPSVGRHELVRFARARSSRRVGNRHDEGVALLVQRSDVALCVVITQREAERSALAWRCCWHSRPGATARSTSPWRRRVVGAAGAAGTTPSSARHSAPRAPGLGTRHSNVLRRLRPRTLRSTVGAFSWSNSRRGAIHPGTTANAMRLVSIRVNVWSLYMNQLTDGTQGSRRSGVLTFGVAEARLPELVSNQKH